MANPHTINAMVRFAVSATPEEYKTLVDLSLIPSQTRLSDPRLVSIVDSMKEKWTVGNRIDRLAVLGWTDYESRKIFSQLLDNLPTLVQEYNNMLRVHGQPPKLEDKDLERYEKAVREISKK